MSSPNNTGFFSNYTFTKYKYLFKFWNFIKFILVIPLIVLHLVIYPFIRIKIGYIMSRTIGNSVAAFEIFFYENKNKKKEIIFWVSDSFVANTFWLKKIKQQFHFFTPAFLGKTMYDYYEKSNFFQIFIVPKRNFNSSGNLDLIKKNTDLSPNADIYRVLKDNKPLIKFDKKEIEAGEKFLEKNNINKNDKIICIQTRSNKYRNEKFIGVRNSSIKNFEKSINFLTNMGCKVIRIGRDENDIILPNNNNFINYAASTDQSDFLDFYLTSKSKFCVCSSSGILEIMVAMRKPILVHNCYPLINLIHFFGDYKKLILPKKIVNKKTKKLQSFVKIFKKDFVNNKDQSKIRRIEDLEKNGIDLIENTDLEILNGVKEMYNLVINKKNIDIDQSKFMMNYNRTFCGLLPNIKIASDFYKENIDLFEKEY